MSPTQPAPARVTFERAAKRKISNAVEDLEDMVQEAAAVAEIADDRGQMEELYTIIEGARDAVHDAITEPEYLMTTALPLKVSESSSSPSRTHNIPPVVVDRTNLDDIAPDVRLHADLPRASVSLSQLRENMLILSFVLWVKMSLAVALADVTTVIPQGIDIDATTAQSLFVDLSPGLSQEIQASGKLSAHSTRMMYHRNHMAANSRQPIARNWSTGKKRLTASVACINTALLGIIVGIYAGEVPRIQYSLADERHITIIGNAVLYAGLAISTFFAWTLPLLHGRKPYILASLAIALPLQFPQAIVVSGYHNKEAKYRVGLLLSRGVSGLVLGFANVNYITLLLDLFGASLQSKNPHQEFFVANDVRRHGGGMGMWLGIWSWCWIASIAVGFQIGAAIIDGFTPEWGFYITVFVLALALVLNIMTSETRRAPFRRSVIEVYDRDENYITRRVSRGEVKLHIESEGPKYWFEEVWAGIKLMTMMLCQPGFLVLALYLGWIYAQVVLVIVLLGALLSRDYRWKPTKVGAGVISIAIGAFLAIPLTKAGIFSRERKSAFRTDSMTFQKQVTWSSHLVRRAIFTLTLPLMGMAYTISSARCPQPWLVPIIFAGAVGFLSILAIAECHGLMMETFDTCDLQPGVNTRHRLQSMAVQDRRRRTNYTSFPRVTAGIFASQIIAFVLAAVATMVGGNMTRSLGAQKSTGTTAGILFGITVLLILVLCRFKSVQVIPNHTFGTRRDTAAWQEFKDLEKVGRGSDWKAVVIGNPSGKMRRMSVLELGALSRWTEIRKLNFLIKGEMLGQPKEKKRSFDGSW
ncbi:hypothetical protein J4E91_009260 [Alternaria rosae]|nr:hypothetical protein J4E91_009260 [Alternaria rosae]